MLLLHIPSDVGCILTSAWSLPRPCSTELQLVYISKFMSHTYKIGEIEKYVLLFGFHFFLNDLKIFKVFGLCTIKK